MRRVSLKKRPPLKADPLAEAARSVYLVAASIEHNLSELLKSKNHRTQLVHMGRLDLERKYLRQHLDALRKETER